MDKEPSCHAFERIMADEEKRPQAATSPLSQLWAVLSTDGRIQHLLLQQYSTARNEAHLPTDVHFPVL